MADGRRAQDTVPLAGLPILFFRLLQPESHWCAVVLSKTSKVLPAQNISARMVKRPETP